MDFSEWTTGKKILAVFAGIFIVISCCYAVLPGYMRWRKLPESVDDLSMRDCLNAEIQKTILTYNEENGPFPAIAWTKTTQGLGTTRDIYYRGTKIASASPDKASYCIGLTFEVYMRAYDSCLFSRLKVGDGSIKAFHQFRKEFYGVFTKRTCVDALTHYGLGVEVKHPLQARPGDLLQFWQTNLQGQPSGHSGIFQDWLRSKEENKIIGFSLFQVSTATKGIAVHDYYFSPRFRQEDVLLVRPVIRK